MVKKIRSRKGESLVETLAGILVVSLVTVFFLAAAATSTEINKSAGAISGESMNIYDEASEPAASTQAVSIVRDGAEPWSYQVTPYELDSGLVRYE